MISEMCSPRLFVRLACFALITAFLWPILPTKSAPRYAIEVSPFAAVCSGIALHKISAAAGFGLAFACIAMLKRRWFCRYICPTGLLLEGVANIGNKKVSWWSQWPPIGRYAALLTIAGAVIGYPVLLWMDPLAIFSSTLAVFRAAGILTGILAGMVLAILILLSLTSGAFWCARLCPLGGTQELLALAGGSLVKKKQLAKPTECGQPSLKLRLASSTRRAFLVGAAGIGVGWLAEKVGAARGEQAPLRPPGAVDEKRFAGLCMRCGNCIRVCPSKIIGPDIGQAGIAGLLAPVIRYEKNYCIEDCRSCTQVCPSGALREMNLEQKRRYIIGEALVDGTLCLVPLGRKDCDACVRSCPFDAIQIRWDEEKYLAYPVVITEKCNGCGACEVACPTEDIKAIRVWKRID
jgi:ferredoxin-type protein NapF